MKIDDVKNYIIKNYEDVICKQTYGETSFFYNPNYALKNGVYFCTIKESDGPADKFSNLNRDGVYRISVGITKEKYLEIFEEISNRPTKGEMIKGDFDFKEKNVIVPHPVYGWMSWVCILEPDEKMFAEFIKYMDISYEKAKISFEKRLK